MSLKLRAYTDGSEESGKLVNFLQKIGEGIAVEYSEGAPAIAFELGGAEIVYHGAPEQREAGAYKELLSLAGEKEPPSDPEFPLEIGIFVTPTCTYCPKAVKAAGAIVLEMGGQGGCL